MFIHEGTQYEENHESLSFLLCELWCGFVDECYCACAQTFRHDLVLRDKSDNHDVPMNNLTDPLALYLQDVRRQFRVLKKQADLALAQVSDDDWFVTLDAESNNLAVIVKHIAGNLRSRWTDIFTSDGEKPDRNRDLEFMIEDGETKNVLQAKWEAGWQCLFDTLASLNVEDLSRAILIRNEPLAVIEAINRQLTHYAGHVGQIVFLARHLASDHWQSLSIPRGQSAVFNASNQPKRGVVWEDAKREIEAT